jgi:hypothetical protein
LQACDLHNLPTFAYYSAIKLLINAGEPEPYLAKAASALPFEPASHPQERTCFGAWLLDIHKGSGY